MNARWLPALVVLAMVDAALAQGPGPGPGGRGGLGPGPGGRFGGPFRDNVQPEPEAGTAKITGRVVSAETGTPIRRAQIRITSRDGRINREVMTDSDGRFEFLSLAAARVPALRQQGRLRHARVRSGAPVRIRKAARHRGRSDAREDRLQPAARQRDHRSHHR